MQSLKKALLAIPGVSALTHHDEQLFRIAFPKDAVHYSRSWLYILRASHLDKGKLGYKFVSPELVAVIGYRNSFIYVTPVFDTSHGIKLRQLCDALVDATGHRIILKKLHKQSFEHAASFDSDGDEPLPLEDDHSAETVLQLQKLFVSGDGTVNPAAKHLIRRARTFNKQGDNLVFINDITKVSTAKIGRFLMRHKEKYANYMPIVQYLAQQKNNEHSYRTLIFLQNNEIRALYIAEILSHTEAGFYCGVTAKNEPGITEWMDIHFFKKLFLEGIRTVHLGGAEGEGIARYIGKLLPSKPSYFVQAMLYTPSAAATLDITIQPARESDLSMLADVYRKTYNSIDVLGEHWTKETAQKFISYFYRRQPDLFFVAKCQDKVIGGTVAGIQPRWDGNHLVEGELFLDPAYKAHGVERMLLRSLLVYARDTYQVVAWDTIMPTVEEYPLALYEKFGFSEVPHWKAVSGDASTLLARLGA